MADARGDQLVSPSFARNFEPIRDMLMPLLGGLTGTVLEIAAGTGHHAAHLAAAFPHIEWLPTDIDPRHLASIEAWRNHVAAPNQRDAALLDAASDDWPSQAAVTDAQPISAIYAQNVLHIAPWAVSVGLFGGAAKCLGAGAPLIVYGPFSVAGDMIGDGNRRFDTALRAENPLWGLRDTVDLDKLATQTGFSPAEQIAMPSNNQILVFRRS
ncbi:MAG: DUF938 domain-containing protein [Pseudomonadota bacterium]